MAGLLDGLSSCENIILSGLDLDTQRAAKMSDGMVGNTWDGLLNGKVEVSLANVRYYVGRLSISSDVHPASHACRAPTTS